MVGIFALCLQSFAPLAAQAGLGEWIVICSEEGTTRIQVDVTTGEPVDHAPCPDCETCHFCAPAHGLGSTELAPLPGLSSEVRQAIFLPDARFISDSRYLWPVTRGPPAATKTSVYFENSDRAFRAFSALNFKSEGAL